MSSEPPAESAVPSFFDRVRDFLLGHPDAPHDPGKPSPAAEEPSPAPDPESP